MRRLTIVFGSLLVLLLLVGCSKKDTGDRRVNFRIYEYSPPVDHGFDMDIYNQVKVWPEEYWENMLTGEYQVTSNASVTYKDSVLVFNNSVGCFRGLNIDLDTGEEFTIKVSMDDGNTYEYKALLPDIALQGHREYITKMPGDSIRYRWSSLDAYDGELIIRRGNNVFDRIKGSGVIVWYINDRYSGSTFDLEFIFEHSFPRSDPFERMNYEYRAYGTMIVP